MSAQKWAITLACALVGWVFCAAVMGLGTAAMPLTEALVIHALAVPIFFVFVSLVYFHRFAYTTPLETACIFTGVMIVMDLLAALLIHRGLAMLANPLGTWVPLILIFSATHMTGLLVTASPRYKLFIR